MRTRRSVAVSLVVALALFAASVANAAGPLERRRKEAEAEAEREREASRVIRMYNVQDLTLGKDYPYPGFREQRGDGLFEGDHFGELYEAAGPEMPDAPNAALTPETVADLIRRTVDPESWREHGGDDGHIQIVGALLVVTQTEANQDLVKQLLDALRTARPMVVVEARWLLVPAANVGAFLPDAAEDRTVPQVIDPKLIERAEVETVYQGHVTCFDRQTVHIVSGTYHEYMTNVEPIVGGGAAALSSVMQTILSGAVIEVTPVLSGDEAVTVKVFSRVTDPREGVSVKFPHPVVVVSSDAGAKGNDATITLPQVMTHAFRTTVRAPRGKLFLAGSMTMPETTKGDVLMLVMRVTGSKTTEDKGE